MAKGTRQSLPAPRTVLEPVLEMADIQGIAIPGFFKQQQTLVYVRFPKREPDASQAVAAFKAFLGEFSPSSAAETLDDRRAYRRGQNNEDVVLKAIGLTFHGLVSLVPDAAQISSPAFRLGLPERSALLGDPTLPDDPGYPSNWQVGSSDKELDALIVFAGQKRDKVTAAAAAVAKALTDMGLDIDQQAGSIRPDLPGHEHFGFDDGVSQPGIRGRASGATDDFITERYIDAASAPFEAAFYGYPGQQLVWPGEFVFGYPASGPDPLLPGPIANGGPTWTRNGSFLVFRKLYQDVAAFWKWISDTRKKTPELASLPDDIALASRLVGRWPSGAPFNRTPGGDNDKLGGNSFENNNFTFDAAASYVPYFDNKGRRHSTTEFPNAKAKADPVGITCPWAAHIRKVNTRDSPSDTGASLSTYNRRLLRVGIPYGPPIKDQYNDDGVDRGLLFLSIQSSIEDQFEFLQARWMNDPTRPKAPAGHDMVVGQNAPTDDGRTCKLYPPNKLDPVDLKAPQQWVQPRGGGYFFLPSIHALKTVVGGNGAT